MAEMQQWWPQLRPETQTWLIDNNGDTVPAAIVREIEQAGGGVGLLRSEDDVSEVLLSDEATDWIDAVANGENPAAELG